MIFLFDLAKLNSIEFLNKFVIKFVALINAIWQIFKVYYSIYWFIKLCVIKSLISKLKYFEISKIIYWEKVLNKADIVWLFYIKKNDFEIF